MSHWTEFLRTANGTVELNRLIGFIGGLAYIASAIGFQWYNIASFDVTAFCLAFSGGLTVIVGGTAGAVAWKDKGVASAKVIQETGIVPSKSAAGTDSNPVKAEIVNTPDSPVVTQDASADERPSYAV